jgi:hypothetical protein
MHSKQLLWSDSKVVGRAATAQDMTCIGGVVDTVNDKVLVDVHCNYFAKHQPA